MAYTINKSNGTFLVTVNDQVSDTTATTLTLPARGAAAYGLAVAENFVYLVENFANTTAPSRPLLGQVWFDTTSSALRFYNAVETWQQVGTDAFGSTFDLLNGPTIAGNTSSFNRLAGSTGYPITYNGTTTTLGIETSEGKVIAVVSAEAIPAASLPTALLIEGRTFPFANRFPNGIFAGMTLATDATPYTYAGSNQFSNILINVPYLLGGDDNGSPNHVVVTVPSKVTYYAEYFNVESKVGFNNTGPTDINVNGLGVRNVTRRDGSPLQANDLRAGNFYHFIYDGSQFQVEDAQANGYVGPTGPAGPIGQTGLQGTPGPQGIQGPTGARGPAGSSSGGSVGPAGPAGASAFAGPFYQLLCYSCNDACPSLTQKVITGWGVNANQFQTSTFSGGTFYVGTGEAGLYTITAQVTLQYACCEMIMTITVNGGVIINRVDSLDTYTNGIQSIGISGAMYLNAGDYFQVTIYQWTAGGNSRYLTGGFLGVIRVPNS